MNITLPFTYSGSVKKQLKGAQFDESIPKHILGFSIDYNLTKGRIEDYFDELEDNESVATYEWKKWANMRPSEKRSYESNIHVLQLQQSLLKEEGGDARHSSSCAAGIKRAAFSAFSCKSDKVDELPIKRRKTGNAFAKQEQNANDVNGGGKISRGSSNSDDEDENFVDDDSCLIKQNPKWDPEEDERLSGAVEEHGRKFALISKTVFGGERSSSACRNRYDKLHRKADGKTKAPDRRDSSGNLQSKCVAKQPPTKSRWKKEEKDILRDNTSRTAKELREFLPSRSERAIREYARVMGLSLATGRKSQSKQPSLGKPQMKSPPQTALPATTAKDMSSSDSLYRSDSSRCSDSSDDDDKTQEMSFVGAAKGNNLQDNQANGNSNVPSEIVVDNGSATQHANAPSAPFRAPRRSGIQRHRASNEPEVIDLVDSDSEDDGAVELSKPSCNGRAPKVKMEMAEDDDDQYDI